MTERQVDGPAKIPGRKGVKTGSGSGPGSGKSGGAASDDSGGEERRGWRTERPRTLPIFPLPGVLLLPGGKLPLNIFEPRYLHMVEDAMASHRMIGMVQPLEADQHAVRPRPYDIGCAGRITSFSETEDGRYLITLSGIIRFRIEEELSVTTPYRQVVADYERFGADLSAGDPAAVDGKRLLTALRAYLSATGIPADWESINRAPLPTLVTSLAMICPFAPSEKQALLEAPDLAERGRTLVALMEMATAGAGQEGEADAPPPKLN